MNNSNSKEYRLKRRVLAYVKPEHKEAVVEEAQKKRISLSRMIDNILHDKYKGKTNEKS